jgi:metallophosphoesterase superfamily enzyme
MLHHPLTEDQLQQTELYSFCGHIHPGVALTGRGRQKLTIACFAFCKKQAILPSFGAFTGRVAIRHQDEDRIFGVLKDKVIAIG